jgi:PilZ domain
VADSVGLIPTIGLIIRSYPPRPPNGELAAPRNRARVCSNMEPSRPYQREHYRIPLPTAYPAMFSDTANVGEGRVTNLTVFGCTIECAHTVPEQTTVLVRLILPDQQESLPIERAEVRWVKGNQVGLRFIKLERAANLRLHVFVWDRMLERLQSIKEQVTLDLYS